MTDLITPEEAQKLLDHCTMLLRNGWQPDPKNFPTEAAPDLARTVIALHAGLAQARAENAALQEQAKGLESKIMDRILEGSVWSMPEGVRATDEWRRGVTDARRDIAASVRAALAAVQAKEG